MTVRGQLTPALPCSLERRSGWHRIRDTAGGPLELCFSLTVLHALTSWRVEASSSAETANTFEKALQLPTSHDMSCSPSRGPSCLIQYQLSRRDLQCQHILQTFQNRALRHAGDDRGLCKHCQASQVNCTLPGGAEL
ncbi:Hypothetical predicted protein [Xyrichtys novacula]|uniref:Uncharacterized protein n=1 Tax=Xyrichtys novacula TaxID=13765 RepID=A0AAV1FYW6_XYRNO|nr:Hypothetical predicted protein [Xyrichtys novacula]